jgi:hypothetical protein
MLHRKLVDMNRQDVNIFAKAQMSIVYDNAQMELVQMVIYVAQVVLI